MTAGDELTFERASQRIVRAMAALAAAGSAVAWAGWGWKAGAGFLFGALISWVNSVFLRALVSGLAGARPRRSTVFMALRLPLLGACAYVILRVSPIGLSAALAGIFVFTAAVFIEAAFEIAYARK
jgi:hypothetical protein